MLRSDGKLAVTAIDMLNDLGLDARCDRATRIVKNLKKLVGAASEHGFPAVFSKDSHYSHDPELVNRSGLHTTKGTKGPRRTENSDQRITISQ